jgi:hypothetical protein
MERNCLRGTQKFRKKTDIASLLPEFAIPWGEHKVELAGSSQETHRLRKTHPLSPQHGGAFPAGYSRQIGPLMPECLDRPRKYTVFRGDLPVKIRIVGNVLGASASGRSLSILVLWFLWRFHSWTLARFSYAVA